MNIGTSERDRRPPRGDVALSAIVAVSWALIGMAGTAALGLHLLEADSTASLGPMTAAVVALGAGGSVTPSGDVSAFGLQGAEAATAIEIAPLGVGLVGALLLSWFFLRSLRGAGVVISPSELLARAGTMVAFFVATLGGLAWAGHDVITIDGGSLGLDDLPGTGGGGGGGIEIPGVGDIGGLLPDRVGDLIGAKAAVGFTVDTVPTLLGGLVWAAAVLTIALLASRRTPLPRGWEAVHRVVRPAVSAFVTVALVAVAAGLAAAAYAAIDDAHPKRIAGAALLGAPNGVWLGIPIGLFVPYDGSASGVLVNFLPDPLDRLLSSPDDQSVSLGRLAELDSRVWLLGVAAALMMLLAGILTAARTPLARGVGSADVKGWVPLAVRDPGALRFAGRCALRLGAVTAVALPLLAWLAEVSVDASISVLGFDAFGAGIELHGQLIAALLLGALWGAGTGALGALLAYASGAAGWRAVPLALGDAWAGPAGPGGAEGGMAGGVAGGAPALVGAGWGPGSAGGAPGPVRADWGPGSEGGTPGPVETGWGPSSAGGAPGAVGTGWGPGSAGGTPGPAGAGGVPSSGAGARGTAGSGGVPGVADEEGRYGVRPEQVGGGGPHPGPYVPSSPYRPPNRETNPYLRLPEGLSEPEDARPAGWGQPYGGGPGAGAGSGAEQSRESGWSPEGRQPYEGGWAPDPPRTGARSPDGSSAPEWAGSGGASGPGPGDRSRGWGGGPGEPGGADGRGGPGTGSSSGWSSGPGEPSGPDRRRAPGTDGSSGRSTDPGEPSGPDRRRAPGTDGSSGRSTDPGEPGGSGGRRGPAADGGSGGQQGSGKGGGPADGRGSGEGGGSGDGRGSGDEESPPENLYGLPTMARPLSPPPRRPGWRRGGSSGSEPQKRTPPPPPPPPPPPGTPKGRR